MKSSLKRAKPGGGVNESKVVRWSEALEKSVWFCEDAAPSEVTQSSKPASSLRFSALSKSKKVEKLGGGENLFNLPIQSKKTNFAIDVPQPTSASFTPKSTFVAAAPLVASNPTIVDTTDWKEAVDASSQETYYYHSKTNATTWEMPLEYKKYKQYLANKDKIAAARKANFAAKLRQSKGEGLLLKKKRADEDDADNESEEDKEGGINIPSHLKYPGEKKKHQTILLAARKFKESSQFEFILKLKQASNPDFAFLNEGNEFHPYYEWLKEDNREVQVSAKLKEDERKEEEAKKKEVARKGPVGLLGAAYSSDEDDSEGSDDDSTVGGGVLVPPTEIKDTVKTMVSFVLKNGLPFEETVREREKHRDTVKFSFLQKDSPYYPFYTKERDTAISARDAKSLDDEMDELERAVDKSTPLDLAAEVANFHLAYVPLYEGGGSGRSTPDTPDRDVDIEEGEVNASSAGIWDAYVKGKAKEAAELVAARGGAVANSVVIDDESSVLGKMKEAHALIVASQEEKAQNDESATEENHAAIAAIEGIKKRSRRQSKFDVEAERKSVKDDSLTKEEKDELRKKRLKRAKMMSGHLKLKMLETQIDADKQKEDEKEKEEKDKEQEQKERKSSSEDGSSESEEESPSRRDRSRDRHRDSRDRRKDRKRRHRGRDRDRDRDRNRDRGRRSERGRDRDRSSRGDRKHSKRSKRSKRSRSRSSS